jgi:serine/threonine-protein kinase
MNPAAAGMRMGTLPRIAKYDLISELGRGGMATVYRARDTRLGREVAVKIIHPHLRSSREVALRFETEARAVAKLRHPNIVEVYDVSDPAEEELYLVVELLRGTTLRTLLVGRGSLPPEVAVALVLELLGALAHAHAGGVIHRDIKPENVLVELGPPRVDDAGEPDVAGNRAIVKLTDFGIAKLLDAQGITSTGQVLGSPAHMAPEQIEGAEVDGRADVFAVGVLLYESMVGHLPFDGDNPAQVLRRVLETSYREAQKERPSIGSRWSAILDRALARRPEERFADASAMREALGAELARLGMVNPRAELEAWLVDADEYERSHATRLRDTLCALGAAARHRHESLSAAADYNRALALFPEDPQLLRIVARMNRSNARVRTLHRAGRILLGVAVAFGAAAMVVRMRAVGVERPRPLETNVPMSAAEPSIAASAAEGLVAPSASPGVPANDSASRSSRAVAPVVAIRSLARVRDAAATPVERALTLDLRPSVGATVAVDGQPPRDVASGESLVLGGEAHSLTFACPVCDPVQVPVRASDKDETLHVVVPVRPATLVINGEPDKAYQIAEMPEVIVRTGENAVPLVSMFRVITVRQIETGETRTIRVKAGDVARVGF